MTKAPKRKRVAVTKTSISDPAPLSAATRPILTRKSKRARITMPPKPMVSSAPVSEAGREKEQSSRPQASKRSTLASKKESRRAATLKEATRKERLSPPEASPQPARGKNLSSPQINLAGAGASASLPSHRPPLRSMASSTALDATPSSQFDPSTGVMLHFVDEDDTLPSSGYEPLSPPVALDKEPIVPEIPVTLDATISQAFARPTVDEPPSSPQDQTQDAGTGSGATFPSIAGGEESSPQQGVSAFSGETPGLSQRASSKEISPPPMARKPKRFHPPSSSGDVDISLSGDEQIKQTEIAPP
ncbi:hypothetical protein ACFX1R_002565 [Malus domestica]